MSKKPALAILAGFCLLLSECFGGQPLIGGRAVILETNGFGTNTTLTGGSFGTLSNSFLTLSNNFVTLSNAALTGIIGRTNIIVSSATNHVVTLDVTASGGGVTSPASNNLALFNVVYVDTNALTLRSNGYTAFTGLQSAWNHCISNTPANVNRWNIRVGCGTNWGDCVVDMAHFVESRFISMVGNGETVSVVNNLILSNVVAGTTFNFDLYSLTVTNIAATNPVTDLTNRMLMVSGNAHVNFIRAPGVDGGTGTNGANGNPPLAGSRTNGAVGLNVFLSGIHCGTIFNPSGNGGNGGNGGNNNDSGNGANGSLGGHGGPGPDIILTNGAVAEAVFNYAGAGGNGGNGGAAADVGNGGAGGNGGQGGTGGRIICYPGSAVGRWRNWNGVGGAAGTGGAPAGGGNTGADGANGIENRGAAYDFTAPELANLNNLRLYFAVKHSTNDDATVIEIGLPSGAAECVVGHFSATMSDNGAVATFAGDIGKTGSGNFGSTTVVDNNTGASPTIAGGNPGLSWNTDTAGFPAYLIGTFDLIHNIITPPDISP